MEVKYLVHYFFLNYSHTEHNTDFKLTSLFFTFLQQNSTPNSVLEVHEHPEEVDLVIKNNQVILGPYNDVNSLEHGIFEVQYELTGAIPHIRRLRREIEVSQWGNNLAVEEHYNFVNRGAEYVPFCFFLCWENWFA